MMPLPQVAERIASGSEGRLPSLQRAGRASRHSCHCHSRFSPMKPLLSPPLNTYSSSALQMITSAAITTKSVTLPLFVFQTGDKTLAQSAQMYHYQHQKQQMLSMGKYVFSSAVFLRPLCHSLVFPSSYPLMSLYKLKIFNHIL